MRGGPVLGLRQKSHGIPEGGTWGRGKDVSRMTPKCLALVLRAWKPGAVHLLRWEDRGVGLGRRESKIHFGHTDSETAPRHPQGVRRRHLSGVLGRSPPCVGGMCSHKENHTGSACGWRGMDPERAGLQRLERCEKSREREANRVLGVPEAKRRKRFKEGRVVTLRVVS